MSTSEIEPIHEVGRTEQGKGTTDCDELINALMCKSSRNMVPDKKQFETVVSLGLNPDFASSSRAHPVYVKVF